MKKLLIYGFLCAALLISGCTNGETMPVPETKNATDIEAEPAVSAEPAIEEIPAQTTEVIPNNMSIKAAEQEDSKLQASAKPTTPAPTATATNNSTSATADTSVNNKDANDNSEPIHSPAPTAEPNAGKTWNDAVYEDVWVVDAPASSYEEPIYEWKSRVICHCGADISGNINAHGDAHLMNGESDAYRTEDYEAPAGTKTITVPEKGHWEKRLVKEGGYY